MPHKYTMATELLQMFADSTALLWDNSRHYWVISNKRGIDIVKRNGKKYCYLYGVRLLEEPRGISITGFGAIVYFRFEFHVLTNGRAHDCLKSPCYITFLGHPEKMTPEEAHVLYSMCKTDNIDGIVYGRVEEDFILKEGKVEKLFEGLLYYHERTFPFVLTQNIGQINH
jgi:hypothetical protein